jgi:hypothetical protein
MRKLIDKPTNSEAHLLIGQSQLASRYGCAGKSHALTFRESKAHPFYR